MRFYIFILASVEPCRGAVCWIPERYSPGGNFYIWLSEDVSITAHKCLSFFKVWWSHWDYVEPGCERAVISKCCNVCLKHHSPSSSRPFYFCWDRKCAGNLRNGLQGCMFAFCRAAFLFCVFVVVFLSIGKWLASPSGGLSKSVCTVGRASRMCVAYHCQQQTWVS